MKELLLPALLDAKHYIGHRSVLPQACSRWLTALMGDVATDGTAVASRLGYAPSAEVLEVWLKEDCRELAETLASYSRIAFRPLVDASPASSFSGATSSSSPFRFQISVELLPAAQVYLGTPLSEMGLVETSPQLVVMDGQVLPYDDLNPRQIGHLDAGYAVVTPELAACLGLPCDGAGQAMASSGPYEVVRQEINRLLPLCFPGGGEAEGCPLRLSFQPEEVPAERLLTVDASYRILQFGREGVGESVREGFGHYGSYRPASHHELRIILLYPRGELDAARRLFSLFSPLRKLAGAVPRGNVNEWVAYDADEHAIDRLTTALYTHPPGYDVAGSCIYCYITPSGSAVVPLASGQVLIRLRQLVRSFGALFVGPVPLHAISPEAFGQCLPSVASRLLAEMGSAPWIPRQFASQDTDLVVGFTHSRPDQSPEAFCAGTFYNDPLQLCRFSLVRPVESFLLFFTQSFRQAYDCFCKSHNGRPPRRLVAYCHQELPIQPLVEFVEWMGQYEEAVPVTLVQLRRTSGFLPRYYDPEAPGCMPVAGTCLRCGGDRYLLFCRGFVPGSGRHRGFYPSPLEVSLKRLASDGSLLSLPPAEADDVLVQACQLAWAHPEGTNGGALPLVLSHTDRLVRHHCQEWLVEMDDRSAITGEAGNLAF